MKKAIMVCGVAILTFSLVACGGKNTENTSGSIIKNPSTSAAPSKDETADATNDITIDQIDYSVGEKIDDGERDVLMRCSNNSPYTISGISIMFKEKPDITEEQKENFYSDLQANYEISDDDMATLKKEEISMYADSDKLIPSGGKTDNIHLYYYSGYYYMKNISHYDLVEPDIATIKYVKDGKIYTEYYDYQSGAYSMDGDIEDAYEWGENSPLAKLVTKPDVELCKVEFDRDDVFWFYAYGCSADDYKAYVEDCKTHGFSVDANSIDEFYSYYATDENGNVIKINYDEDDGSISVDISAANG